MNDQTIKADAGKPQLHLVPAQIIRDIAEVREYGVGKYGDTDSWRRVELMRYVDALYRHMLAFLEEPHSRDDESGIPHYKHLACNAAFICELMKERAEGETESAIKEATVIDPTKWIPVAERLPERGECLVAHADGTVHPASVLFGDDFEYCTHWMPLPEHPNCGARMDMEGNHETD